MGFNMPSRITWRGYQVEKQPWGSMTHYWTKEWQMSSLMELGMIDARNPSPGKAGLAIHTYFVCVKRNVAVIISMKEMDFADKDDLPYFSHTQ